MVGYSIVSYLLFLVMAIAARLLPSLFWGMVADLTTSYSANLSFTYISVGGQLGSILGSFLSMELVLFLSPLALIHVCSIIFAFASFSLSITWLSLRKKVKEVSPTSNSPDKFIPAKKHESPATLSSSASSQSPPASEPFTWRSFSTFWKTPYTTFLFALSIDMIFYSLLGSLIDLQLTFLSSSLFPSPTDRFAYFAQLDFISSACSICLQLLWSKFFHNVFSIRWILLFSPLITLITSFIPLIFNTSFVFSMCYVLRRVIVYSISKPAQESVYTVVSPSDKYATKSFIDTVAFRIGDLGGAWIFVLAEQLHGGVGFEMGYLVALLTVFWVPVRVHLANYFSAHSGVMQ